MNDADDTVEGAKQKFAEMQAKMEQDIQEKEQKMAQQQADFEAAQQ